MRMRKIPEMERNIKAIARVKKILNENGGILLNLTLSGSDLYGFTSEDSDFDYRGSFVFKTNKLLGLSKPKDVIEFQEGDFDLALFEIGKELSLALKGNCNVLEHINAKQIYSTPEFLTLKPMIMNSWGKSGVYGSYKGMAMFNYKKFIASGRKNTIKKYLYVYRALCAGIYALETKRIEPNILVLNKYFKLPELKDLVQLKKKGKEVQLLDGLGVMDAGNIEDMILRLFERFDKAYKKCNLPEKPERKDVKEIESWLIKLRKKYLD